MCSVWLVHASNKRGFFTKLADLGCASHSEDSLPLNAVSHAPPELLAEVLPCYCCIAAAWLICRLKAQEAQHMWMAPACCHIAACLLAWRGALELQTSKMTHRFSFSQLVCRHQLACAGHRRSRR